MLTFPPPTIQSISLIPLDSEETGGRFRVWLYMPAENGGFLVPKLVWDRKIEGGFPELKVLVRCLGSLLPETLLMSPCRSNVSGTILTQAKISVTRTKTLRMVDQSNPSKWNAVIYYIHG
jgi:predicted Rdx family selenoprotein